VLGILDGQMTQASDTLNNANIAGCPALVGHHGVEDGCSGTTKRRELRVRHDLQRLLVNTHDGAGRGIAVLAVTSVDGDAAVLNALTRPVLSLSAVVALVAVASVPAEAHQRARCKSLRGYGAAGQLGTHGDDAADDLVAGDSGELEVGPQVVPDEVI
jgi:hypothetical protein